MGLLDRFKRTTQNSVAAKTTPIKDAPIAFFFDEGRVTPLGMKYRDGEFHSDLSSLYRPYSGYRELGMNEDAYARAYMTCVWVFRAINVRVTKISEVLRHGRIVERGNGQEVKDHRFTRALEVSYQAYMQDIFEEWTFSKSIYGEAYIEKVSAYPFPQYGVPAALRVLNALAAEPIDVDGEIVGYRYRDVGRMQDFALKDIAFDRTKNPLDDLRGYSLVAAAMDAVNIDRSILVLTRSHLKNNARPGLIFTPKEGRLTQADVDLIQTTLIEDLKSPANAGHPLLMPTAFDVTVAEPPKLTDVDAMSEQQKRRICSVVGVPVALVDYTDMAFQLSPEQKTTFYDLTLIPEAEKIVRVINAQVLPFFDPAREVEFKLPLDEIRAGLGDPAARTTIYGLRLQSGGITLNEYRTALGEKAVPDGDVRFVPAGIQVIKAGELGNVQPMQQPLTPSPSTTQPPPPSPSPNSGRGESAGLAANADAISGEIKAWQKKTLRHGALKAFTCNVIPRHVEQYIREELEAVGAAAERAAVKAIFDDVLMITGDAIKAYEDTRAAFVEEMTRIIGEGQRSDVSRQKFGGQMRSACRRAGLQAMRDGMNEVGYDPESLSMEELAAFRQWQEAQSAYVGGLGAELFKEGGISEGEIAIRADMWASMTLESARELGLRLGKPNQRMKWVRGATADSCADCIRLENQVHTMKGWIESGWTPTSKKTICHSYNCLCQLMPTDEAERGEF